MSFVPINGSHGLSYLNFSDIHRTKPVVFLHGIMGSKKNLTGFIQKLFSQCPNNSGLVFDLRNHGHSSKHWSPFTVDACAGDIKAACHALSVQPQKIVGHSFGGKVALLLADMMESVEEVWLLDCSPGLVTGFKPLSVDESLSALQIIKVLSELSWPCRSRNDLVDKLVQQGVNKSIAAWMTTNLESGPDGLYLVFEPSEMSLLLTDFMALDGWPLIPRLTERMSVHLVSAEHGHRVTKDDEIRLANLAKPHRGFFHLLKNAGHFLHADNPNGLIDIMKSFFS